jgi:Fur family transcriptional regulator, peroxide stress response regulator
MTILNEELRKKLAEKGLKITPQRMNILRAIYEIDDHPTVEMVLDHIREMNPNIAKGTVYNVLETLVENKLIAKVKTEKGIYRYDGLTKKHHHIYCEQCDYIEDYFNEELDQLINDFFKLNHIKNFKIEDIKLHISGNFIVHKNKSHLLKKD